MFPRWKPGEDRCWPWRRVVDCGYANMRQGVMRQHFPKAHEQSGSLIQDVLITRTWVRKPMSGHEQSATSRAKRDRC